MTKPYSGQMVYWRGKGKLGWKFGYVTYTNEYNLIRLGNYNGDTMGGIVVDCFDIDWKPYH